MKVLPVLIRMIRCSFGTAARYGRRGDGSQSEWALCAAAPQREIGRASALLRLLVAWLCSDVRLIENCETVGHGHVEYNAAFVTLPGAHRRMAPVCLKRTLRNTCVRFMKYPASASE